MKMSQTISRDFNEFVDILNDRRGTSDIIWASRKWEPTVAHVQSARLNGDDIKSIVLNSQFLKHTINKIHHKWQVPVDRLFKNAEDILHEIGFYRQLPVIRWFGVFISKILKKLYSAVFVNEAVLYKIKSQMGSHPVLFVPSHKSYCDFVLMAYICFHFDVDIPRIAAGMDFQSMAIIGNLLRDACAFFIRRSFNNDELYSSVFSQYVQTLITYGDGPVEFFIEGTRSRTAKSLAPKYGFLSMALKPFFFGLVPDISLIPVNLSYDKILEELLFAYELLGIPKPKESTMGFLKALSILNENYGTVYAKFGEPISVKEYFGNKIDRSVHNSGPVHLQELSLTETKEIINLAHEIIRQQRRLTVLNTFNLIALIVNNSIISSEQSLETTNLLKEVKWISSVLNCLNSDYVANDISKDNILQHLSLHRMLIIQTKDCKINLRKMFFSDTEINSNHLKGHKLAARTLDVAVPMIMLQNYLNPCAYFLASVSFISLIINSISGDSAMLKDHLFNEFKLLTNVFAFEFVFHVDDLKEDFDKAFTDSQSLGIIGTQDANVRKGENEKLRIFCVNFLNSFIPGYMSVAHTLLEFIGTNLTEKEILQSSQERLESQLNGDMMVHPNNLSLDVLKNALQAFVSMGAVFKRKGNQVKYAVMETALRDIQLKLRTLGGSTKANHNILQQFSNFTKSSL